jgi:hypothetical protein
MPNEFIVKNGLISQGNVTVSGSIISPNPIIFNNDIYLSGSRTIQVVATSSVSSGPSLTLKGGAPNTGSYTYGGHVVIQGADAINPAGIGGSIYLYGGNGAGSQSGGSIYLGAQSGTYQVYLQGSPRFTWDGPNAANAVLFQRGGSTRFYIYDDVNLNANYYFYGGATTINAIWSNWKTTIIRGSGATSATTAFQVQNANASSSLTVLDNGFVGINTGSAQYNLDVNGSLRASSINVPTVGESSTSANITSTGTGVGFGFFSSTVHFTDASSKLFGGGNAYNNKGFVVGQDAFLGWRRTGNILNGIQNTETRLYSDANNTIDQRNSAASQSFRIYNTYTDASNYERNTQAWSSNTFNIINEAAGTGVVRSINIQNTLNISGSNVGIGTSGSLSKLAVYKSGSTVLDIQGSQGQLFSVVDALSGSLMSVNDVSGLPILEVFSDDRVVMGTYGAPALTVSGSAVTVATASAAPTGTVPEGTFRFATVGGAYFIYAYLGGAWRSGSLF